MTPLDYDYLRKLLIEAGSQYLVRHQPAFHAVRRAEPMHFPAARAQRFGDREAGEDVAARAACHHECRLHARPPRISMRFS